MSIEKVPQEPEKVNPEKEEPMKEIKDANDFGELIQILGRKEEIIGSGGREYSTEKLISDIKSIEILTNNDDMEEDERSIEIGNLIIGITRSGGLRNKVSELCRKEKRNGKEKEKPMKEIKDANDFGELIQILEKKEKVGGYALEYLKKSIKYLVEIVNNLTVEKDDEYRDKMLVNILEEKTPYITAITRKEGLRDKVIELLKPNIEKREKIIIE